MEKEGENPSIDDLAECIAAHFLNPYIKTPITVGIAGECGSGDVISSLMTKIEKNLHVTAAHAAYLDIFKGKKDTELSVKGRRIKTEVKNLQARKDKEKQGLPEENPKERKEADDVMPNPAESKEAEVCLTIDRKEDMAVLENLMEYYEKDEAVYKYLACMELKQLVKDPKHESFRVIPKGFKVKDREIERKEIPRVLTLKFNAEDYMGTHEACDGLVVEIAKAIENSMTRAQRWSAVSRNNSQSLFKILDLIIAAGVFAVVYVVWMLIQRFNATKLKYGTIPAFGSAATVPFLRHFFSYLKSKEMSKFVADLFMSDKSDQNNRQQTVISKIKLLKKESGEKPYTIFSLIAGEKWRSWWGLVEEKIEKTGVPKYGSAPEEKLRIIAFMDGLDRYEDSVIVRVLRSLNTVLKTCDINFVLALDKTIIRRAFKTSTQNAEDADLLISQIIQLPVTLHPVFKDTSEKKGEEGVLKSIIQVQQMSKMTIVNHDEEDEIFEKLKRFSREISGIHLNYLKYHMFARNVISQIMEDTNLVYEKLDKELVAWIFICSQWRSEMNTLIQDWHAYVEVKGQKGEPSLKEIVANYVKEHVDIKAKEKNPVDSQENGIKDVDSKEADKKEKGDKLKGDIPRWKSLQKALEVQDVSMNGIQFFQHFRFHCDAGYLNRPSKHSST